MGSEGSPSVTVHVTGFKKFHGVSENPTETIVNNLQDYLEKKGLPKGLILGSCTVLQTAGEGALVPLYQTLQNSIDEKNSGSSNSRRIIWVHFGVNSGATKFALEQQAVNEATFRCPDEMGWKPQKVPIIPADGEISRVRQTSLPVEEMTKTLAKKGYDVMASDDAGRFVCNYVYYHSLRFSEQNKTDSLFVHVPLFLTIDKETQMQFAASLLEEKRRPRAGLHSPNVDRPIKESMVQMRACISTRQRRVHAGKYFFARLGARVGPTCRAGRRATWDPPSDAAQTCPPLSRAPFPVQPIHVSPDFSRTSICHVLQLIFQQITFRHVACYIERDRAGSSPCCSRWLPCDRSS